MMAWEKLCEWHGAFKSCLFLFVSVATSHFGSLGESVAIVGDPEHGLSGALFHAVSKRTCPHPSRANDLEAAQALVCLSSMRMEREARNLAAELAHSKSERV